MTDAGEKPVTRVLLVRHGQSTWNAEGRWQGWADPPLSDLGREQAKAAAPNVADVAGVVSSDLVRARETAEIIASSLGLGAVERFRGLRERDVGEWQGLTRAEIEEGWPGTFATSKWVEPPGAEAMATLLGRAIATIHRIVDRHPGRDVLAVTHGGLIRNLERHLGIEPEHLPNLAGRWINVDGSTLTAGDRVLLIDPEEVPVTTPRQL